MDRLKRRLAYFRYSGQCEVALPKKLRYWRPFILIRAETGPSMVRCVSGEVIAR